jgi:hypothetical protein
MIVRLENLSGAPLYLGIAYSPYPETLDKA